MATINVEATVSAPSKINIPLVRADHHATSNVFRLLFEVSLAGSSTTIGVILTMPQPTAVHWVLLGVLMLFTLAFLGLTLYFGWLSKKTS